MDPSGEEDVVVERGAVLVIAGCVLVYLAFLSTAFYQGASEPAHLAAGAFIVLAAWSFAGGLMGLMGDPRSTRWAGGTYAACGWILAGAVARVAVTGVGAGTLLLAAVAAPAVLLAEAYGAALVRGLAQPLEDDALLRPLVQRLEGALSYERVSRS